MLQGTAGGEKQTIRAEQKTGNTNKLYQTQKHLIDIGTRLQEKGGNGTHEQGGRTVRHDKTNVCYDQNQRRKNQ